MKKKQKKHKNQKMLKQQKKQKKMPKNYEEMHILLMKVKAKKMQKQ